MSDAHRAPAGFTWNDYLGLLVAQEGSLTAVAEKLAATRSYDDDVASVERALRRLRTRELRPGGKWGARLLALFGLPESVEARLRWMGSYHSSFTDLPVPVCDDLVRLWDHPPTTGRRQGRAWLSLARASIALRRSDQDEATARVAQIEASGIDVEAQIEALLVRAYVASRRVPAEVDGLLAEVEPLLPLVASADDRACLHARWIDQRAYAVNAGGRDPAAAEALYEELPASGVPPFVAYRRAAGLAFSRWKRGDRERATTLVREAIRHAGDGGLVRLRAMGLGLLARIDPGETEAHARAAAIAKRLEDETLRLRLERR